MVSENGYAAEVHALFSLCVRAFRRGLAAAWCSAYTFHFFLIFIFLRRINSYFMKVICDSVGKCHLCNGCGAAVPHEHNYCEPCPILTAAKCVEVIFNDTSLNYDEDFKHENGNYQNYCRLCSTHFLGHKYRRTCKRCLIQFSNTPSV